MNPYLTGMALAAGTNSGLVTVPSVSSVTLPGGGANVRITFSAAHGIKDNQPVTISGTTGVTGLNATWPATYISATVIELVGSGALTGTPAGSPAAAIPTLDISSYTAGFEIQITAVGDGQLSIEDSVDAFSASVVRWTAALAGSVCLVLTPRDFLTHERFGTASAVLRLRCVSGSFTAVSFFIKAV